MNERYKALARTFERIDKIPGERASLEAMIADFAGKGWPVDTLQARLERLNREDAGYPVSDRFKWQVLPDFALEDGYAVYNEHGLTVVLWRQSRVYKLNFGYIERGVSNEQVLQRLDPHVRRVLAALRPRAAFEVPRQPGICLPFGFLADDGTAPMWCAPRGSGGTRRRSATTFRWPASRCASSSRPGGPPTCRSIALISPYLSNCRNASSGWGR
ncbi:hypothetical protein NWF32_14855 [Pseudomonas qingdaonensis]|nr:hypothetical protein [Pseudomonas qingdaonensis]